MSPKQNATALARRLHSSTVLFMLMTIIAVMTIAMILANPTRVQSQTVALIKVDVAVVAKGLRASKIIGTGVVNDKNEKIGSVEDLIIDQPRSDQSRPLFAVLQVGGFLGLGGKLVAVPYESLKVTDDGRRIELPNASKDELKNLTEFKHRT